MGLDFHVRHWCVWKQKMSLSLGFPHRHHHSSTSLDLSHQGSHVTGNKQQKGGQNHPNHILIVETWDSKQCWFRDVSKLGVSWILMKKSKEVSIWASNFHNGPIPQEIWGMGTCPLWYRTFIIGSIGATFGYPANSYPGKTGRTTRGNSWKGVTWTGEYQWLLW